VKVVLEPSAWKKLHQLRGKDKEGGRQRALQLFPAQHALLALKRVNAGVKMHQLAGVKMHHCRV
jgi:hypothetical protein